MASHPPATIVVLESHPAALDLIERTLRERGDRVLATHDPTEAYELAQHVRIDLLVGETKLIESHKAAFLPLGHELRILYLGSLDDSKPGREDGATTLHAPFSLDELREAVAAALGRPL